MESINKRKVILISVYLTLVTMADTATTSVLGHLVSPYQNEGGLQQPGYWNILTFSIITSTAFELIGQIVLGVTADKKSGSFAMLLSTFSVFFSTLVTALSLAFHEPRPTVALVVLFLAPLAKLIGGGSHAAAFLTYALLCEQTSGASRVALLFSTGAIVALSQEIATVLTSITLSHSIDLSFDLFILPIICEMLTFGIVAYYGRSSTTDPSSEPLLFEPTVSMPEPSEEIPSDGTSYITSAKEMWLLIVEKVSKDRNLVLPAFIVAVAGISKATEPLFTFYVEHRYEFSRTESETLWATKLLISTIIFLVVLPLAVYAASRWELTSPKRLALGSAKISILLAGAGALMTGLPLAKPVLIAVNTLGVAMDLSVISFAVEFIPKGFSGRYFQLLASIESLSVLIGIGVLYPAYQWGINKSGFAGGITYCIWAAPYAIMAAIIWQLKPASGIRL